MDATLTWLSRSGEAMWSWLIGANAWAAGVLVACVALDRLLARRVGAGWRVVLYTAVFVRAAMPGDWSSPVGVIATGDAPAPWRQQDRTGKEAPGLDEALPASGDAIGPASPETGVEPLATATHSAWWLIPSVYWMGIGVLACAWIAQRCRAARLVRHGAPAPEWTAAHARRLPVVVHPCAGPMLAGLWWPVVVLPRGMVESMGRRALEDVLRHEASHAARRDHLTAALVQWLVIALWPIVPAWAAGARVRALLEQACDDRAAALGGDRTGYATTLMDVAASLAAAPRVARTGALHFGNELRARVRALVFTRRWRVGVQAALVVVGAAALVACAGTRQARDAAGPSPQRAGVPVIGRIQPAGLVDAPGSTEDQSDGVASIKGRHGVGITILRAWPKHPKLEWDVRQTSGDVPFLSDIPIVGRLYKAENEHLLDPAEWKSVLAGAEAMGNAVVAQPRMELILGLTGLIRMGNDDAQGKPADGRQIELTITNRETTAEAPGEWRSWFTIAYEEFGPEKERKSYRAEKVVIPDGKTLAILVTGIIGGEQRLVCITPAATVRGPAGVTGMEAPDPVWRRATDPEPGFPRVRWTALIYRTTMESRRAQQLQGKQVDSPGVPVILPQAQRGRFLTDLESLPGVKRLGAPTLLLGDGQRGDVRAQARPSGTRGEQEIVEIASRFDADGLVVCGAVRARTFEGVIVDFTEFNDLHLPVNGDWLVIDDPPAAGKDGRLIILYPRVERSDQDVPRQTLSPGH